MSARAKGAEGSRCDISGADKHRGIASTLSSLGDSFRDSPVKKVVGAPANSARRERSFNSTVARMDGQVSMIGHELMNAQCHRLIALYPIRNNLLSGNSRFWTIERCEQQNDSLQAMRTRATHACTQKSCQGAISIGPVLPRTWTPPGTPRDRDGELDIETFKRGETDMVGGWPRRASEGSRERDG
jgi:hypothetical protein